MNKRTSLFYFATVGVAIACLILDLLFPNSKFSFLGICFAITMLVYGLCLILRGFRFKIDSSLFLGIIILGFGIISTMTYFTPWGYFDLWHYLLLSASISSLVTGAYFKVLAHKKLSILFLILFIIALCYQAFNLFKFWVMIVAMIGAVIAFIVINNILIRRK